MASPRRRRRSRWTRSRQLPAAKYGSTDGRRGLLEQIETRLAGIPGIEGIALTSAVPPFASGQRNFEIEGRPAAGPGEQLPGASTISISPRFFEVVDVPLERGRAFAEADGTPGFETVIVNARMASQFFPGEDPIGRRLRIHPRDRRPGDPAPPWRTIVGISPTIRQGSAELGGPPNAVIYLAYRQ